MTAALSLIGRTAASRWKTLLIWAVAMAVIYQVALMVALMARFGDLPNYWVWYDWPGNVARIIRMTPSVSDMGPIIAQEWLLEIGFMNYDFGAGISEWALTVVPANIAVLMVMGALAGLCACLARAGTCPTGMLRASGGATTAGAALVLFTNATMSWVVCCATPSWVVGLAMLGMGVSTSLALESMGPILSAAGFGLLLLGVFLIAWLRSRTPAPAAPAKSAMETA
jgi:hypothetical protein